ncbi:nucleoid-associated protein [Acetobacter ascendens]|uniref:Nucleoid-associated protein n=1 Tax=Acetobacter ascendens TaxID=481146 RepID=A0A1Y0V111_9PROT|nr:nucleoid-associated protein [Acetobacter ascendens]ARW11751.1 hypothetical protein S101447_02713 [Acetobacter ascendens]
MKQEYFSKIESVSMAFWDEDQLENLSIERMIFHVVGVNGNQLTLLDEVDPGNHAGFFIDRLRSTNGGTMFDFFPASGVYNALNDINSDEEHFVAKSCQLAELFNAGHSGNTKAGVFLLFILSALGQRFYALVKYDDEQVLSYKIQEAAGGRKKALIEALQRTFVRSPDALQKSALIRLHSTGGELCVRDRVSPKNISRYFVAFLGAKRRFNEAELTEKLSQVTKEVARKNKTILPIDVIRDLNRRVYNAIQNLSGFSPADKEAFLAAVFGALNEDSKIRTDFDRVLKRERMEDEAFEFDRNAIVQPKKKHIVTTEGIEVIWDHQYDDRIHYENTPEGGKLIKIMTGGISVDDDYPESRS